MKFKWIIVFLAFWSIIGIFRFPVQPCYKSSRWSNSLELPGAATNSTEAAKSWNGIPPLSPFIIACCSKWNWIRRRGTLSTLSCTVRASSTFSWTTTTSRWVSLTAKRRSLSIRCPFSRPYLTTSRSGAYGSRCSWRGYWTQGIIHSLYLIIDMTWVVRVMLCVLSHKI